MSRVAHLGPRVLFGLLFALVTYLTLTPNPDDVEPGFAVTRWISSLLFGDPKLADKVAHFLAYAALGAMAVWAHLSLFGRRLGAALALAVYGVFLEWLQGVGGVRSPELADAVANGLGALSGAAGAVILNHLIRRVRRA
ncbi:VanZ family protein [Hyphococcus sp.]|uniref:VanZ family protein n=1 Tax=Hyphococcus sp. TaxID=2038636 RepID=UPI0035C77F31